MRNKKYNKKIGIFLLVVFCFVVLYFCSVHTYMRDESTVDGALSADVAGIHIAIDGKDMIKSLQDKYGQNIQILAGSGVNYNNASSLMEYTGIDQVHSSCKDYEEDPTTSGKSVTYSYYTGAHVNDYESVDQENVEKLVSSLQNK